MTKQRLPACPAGDEIDCLLAEASAAEFADRQRTDRVWQGICADLRAKAHCRHGWVWVQRIVGIAAALIVLASAAFPIAMASSEWFRSAVWRLVLQEQGNGVTVSLQADPAESFPVPTGWEGLYFPAALPEGFRLSAVNDAAAVELTDGAGHLLLIEEHLPQDPAWVSTTGKTVEKQSLGQTTAYLIEGGGSCTVIVQAEERLLILSAAGLTRGELLEIAGSVRRVVRMP